MHTGGGDDPAGAGGAGGTASTGGTEGVTGAGGIASTGGAHNQQLPRQSDDWSHNSASSTDGQLPPPRCTSE